MQSGQTSGGPALRHAYVEVNGVRLHYVERGTGPMMLFLHGFPDFWYSWNALLPEFAKDHRAVALDMRGYNLSAMPPEVDAYQIPYWPRTTLPSHGKSSSWGIGLAMPTARCISVPGAVASPAD
jgi:pimeloyl-ACP methyl ester carboxylesterase